MLATALLLRTVESLRFVFGGCVLGCGLKGEAVGKEDGSAMGSDDDDAMVGSWAGQYGTSARSGASACGVSLRTNESNESNENMKTEASSQGWVVDRS